MKIVYDCDDTLWPFNERICEKTGIPIERHTDFSIYDIPGITQDEINSILKEFQNPMHMKDINWYPGIEQIARPMLEFGDQVIIKSNRVSQLAADLQTEQLIKTTGLPRENIHMNIISLTGHQKKEIDPDTDIFIDDSPYNIGNSPAVLNLVKVQPWNITPKAKYLMGRKHVIYFESLIDITDFVYKMARMQSIYQM